MNNARASGTEVREVEMTRVVDVPREVVWDRWTHQQMGLLM